MISILVNDIIPILVIMILGYLCGKFSFFNDDQRQGLNKLVLNIAFAGCFVCLDRERDSTYLCARHRVDLDLDLWGHRVAFVKLCFR